MSAVCDNIVKMAKYGNVLGLHLDLTPPVYQFVEAGIKRDLALESIIIASFCTTGTRDVFIHPRTEYEQIKLENAKAKFIKNDCHGDILLWLRVFKAWSATQKRTRPYWCSENCLDDKQLRKAAEVVYELQRSNLVKKYVQNPRELTFSSSDASECKIVNLILSCFHDHVSVYNGVARLGYTNLAKWKQVFVDPLSIFCLDGKLPKFAVYIATRNNFMAGIVSITEQQARDILKQRSINLQDVPSLLIVDCLGEKIRRHLSANGNEKVRTIEKSLKEQCGSKLMALEVDECSGNILVFSRPCHHHKARRLVTEYIDLERKRLFNDTLNVTYPKEMKGVQLVLGHGGEIKEILCSYYYRTLLVECTALPTESEELSKNYIVRKFQDVGLFEDVENITEKHIPRAECSSILVHSFAVTFRNHDSARKALSSFCPIFNPSLRLRPFDDTMSLLHEMSSRKYHIKIVWPRRAKNFRQADVSFFSEGDCDKALAIHEVDIHNQKAVFERFVTDKGQVIKDKLVLVNIDYNLQNEIQVKNAIEKAAKVCVKDVAYQLLPPFPTPLSGLGRLEQSIKTKLKQNLGQLDDVTVRLTPPKNEDAQSQGYISTSNLGHLTSMICAIKNPNSFLKFTIHQSYKLQDSKPRVIFHTTPHIFGLLKDSLNSCLEDLRIDGDLQGVIFTKQRLPDETLLVEVAHSNVMLLQNIHEKFTELFQPFRINHLTKANMEYLTCHGDMTRTLSLQTATVIKYNKKELAIDIYGLSDGKIAAKSHLIKVLGGRDRELCSRSISLRRHGEPVGLIRGLVNKYGPSLHILAEETGVKKITLDLKKQDLNILGCEDSCCKVESAIRICSEQLRLPDTQLKDSSSKTCCVCFCDEDCPSYTPELCGHVYCLICFRLLIDTTRDLGRFPIMCAAENCNQPVTVKDLIHIYKGKDTPEFWSLVEASLRTFIIKKRDIARFCSTPDCSAVYRVSQRPEIFSCPQCKIEICASCHGGVHRGMPCNVHAALKTIDRKVREWMEEKPTNRKLCPKCQTGIEKVDGCDNIFCTACKSNICWKCLGVFETSSLTYNHMRSCNPPGE